MTAVPALRSTRVPQDARRRRAARQERERDLVVVEWSRRALHRRRRARDADVDPNPRARSARPRALDKLPTATRS